MMKIFSVFLCCFYSLFVSTTSFALSKADIEKLLYSNQFKIPDSDGNKMLTFKFPPYNSDNLLLGPCAKTGLPTDGCTGILPLAEFYFDKNTKPTFVFILDGVNFNGGSATYTYLWAMIVDDSNVISINPVDFGDRVLVKGTQVNHDTIIIKAITHKSSDAACCPTKKSTLIYKVRNGSLVNINR